MQDGTDSSKYIIEISGMTLMDKALRKSTRVMKLLIMVMQLPMYHFTLPTNEMMR
jgi:hypothetical protein